MRVEPSWEILSWLHGSLGGYRLDGFVKFDFVHLELKILFGRIFDVVYEQYSQDFLIHKIIFKNDLLNVPSDYFDD